MGRKRYDRQRPAAEGDRDRGTGQRLLRVGERLRHVLSEILQSGQCRDPALRDTSITVSEVRISPDLRAASVFVMPLAGVNAAGIVAALERSTPFLRGLVARELALRHAPNLVFALDRSFEQADQIARLLARPEVERDLRAPGASAENYDNAG